MRSASTSSLGVRGVVARQFLEELLRLAIGVLLVLRVRLDRLALAGERLEQVVELVVDRRLDVAGGPIVVAGLDGHVESSPAV